ncbi:hypothetical protein ACHAW6_000707 [Cyclotella cf. meneghiniana]
MALNARDLPWVGTLVHYLHAAAGFPITSTWLAAIKAGNYASWPGLTYANTSKYCPDSTKTKKGQLSQNHQGPSLLPHHYSRLECNLQLIPPNFHHANAAERAIQTFKAHFLSILAGIDDRFPNYLWDKLLTQAELSLNLLRQASLAPAISAWVYFHDPFYYDTTPLGPHGMPCDHSQQNLHMTLLGLS